MVLTLRQIYLDEGEANANRSQDPQVLQKELLQLTNTASLWKIGALHVQQSPEQN